MKHFRSSLILFSFLFVSTTAAVEGSSPDNTRIGYYRHPVLSGETVVFVAEGDLWQVDVEGGVAQRLTTHPGLESNPAISPDGAWLAFSAQYEGPTEAYVMPFEGGLPMRLTYHGRKATVVGWTPDGKVLCATQQYSTLPSTQLVAIAPETGEETVVPLAQAAEASFDPVGKTIFFTRFAFQGSYTKRYRGGTAQNIWKYDEGAPEALLLTADYPGTSKSPMWYNDRIYFASDRDGTLNLWSMNTAGQDLRQETSHSGWDVKYPSLNNGRIVYQLGADLCLFNVADKSDRLIPITLASDFDQMRENWVEKPFDYLTASHVSPDGDRVVITARGQAFVAPVGPGRLVKAASEPGVRYSNVLFMPDGKSLVGLSDASGELEFWKLPADGIGEPEQLSSDGTVFRFYGLPSPDGKLIAFTDKDYKLWIYDIDRKRSVFVDSSRSWEEPTGLAWSPDSRWLAYSKPTLTFLGQIYVYNVAQKNIHAVSTDRFSDFSPAWSPDGKWLYFLSDRSMNSVVPSVWTIQQPFPFVDDLTKVYMLPLKKGLRSPFKPRDELQAEESSDKSHDSIVTVTIDFDGIFERIMEVPVAAGKYYGLEATDKQLLWLEWSNSTSTRTLKTIEIKDKDAKVETVIDGVNQYELSGDGKKIFARKSDAMYVFDVGTSAPSDLSKSQVNLSGWTFTIDPKQEWRQMFVDAWRMERDYFYDPGMHGVDWDAVLEKYLPLVDRITDRHELSDLLGEMVGELTSLHIYVYGGEQRKGPDNIQTASLGAVLSRDERADGFRVEHIYMSDPDEPDALGPLSRPGVDISEGDIITEVNGRPALSATALEAHLRHLAGKQVLMTVVSPSSNTPRKVIVEPITSSQAKELQYRDWEYRRRLMVEKEGGGKIGYVHLRATSNEDYSQWVRDFYPVFDRQGLIVDLRHNNGGNIDSWIITTLMRKSWAYWQGRAGSPYSNMQQAFNGHLAVLIDEWTASDGELFAEGIRRLGLGKVIGTRSWGGEIWLSQSNFLVDKGIASAAEFGVYGPEGEWLIENRGVEPDIFVDNLPHETFNGKDAQLEAAIEYLVEQIRLNPYEVPKAPPYPDKSFTPGESD